MKISQSFLDELNFKPDPKKTANEYALTDGTFILQPFLGQGTINECRGCHLSDTRQIRSQYEGGFIEYEYVNVMSEAQIVDAMRALNSKLTLRKSRSSDEPIATTTFKQGE
ncbi:MAG: hypothetical protein EOO39_18665 [Cytophagaceae bacterium]|nr:MAG: hypothetical protein EOO39_18665 [Cytophagaceae bacterium]